MATGSFFVTEKLGPKQSITPEGFLLCEEVPIARTGMMIYGPDETPVSSGPDGLVKIFREAEDVFRPETIASAQGKPVTNDHPEQDVTPESWKELTHGIAMNVRRGLGAMDDLLLADFLITTPEGIKEIQSGKREVSLGYEADYEEVQPGVGKQTNLIINHIALVEQGRCGPRCAISDSKPDLLKGKTMARKSKSKIFDALMKAFKAKDADEVEKLANEVTDELEESGAVTGGEEGGDTHIHIHNGEAETSGTGAAMEAEGRTHFTDDQLQEHMDRNEAEHSEMFSRIDALEKLVAKLAGGEEGEETVDEEIEGELREEAPEGTGDEAVKAKDSAYLQDSYQDTVAMAEILVPGISIPTFDRAAKPGSSYKKICGLRRQALDLAYVQPATRGILDELTAGKTLDTKNMTCDAIRTLFRSAAAMKRAANNGARHPAHDTAPTARTAPRTLAEVNRINAERYKNSGKAK